MKFTINEFIELTIFIFFLYLFFETKIYIFLWYSVFELLNSLRFLTKNVAIFKIVIVTYVVSIVLGYLYKFRYLFFTKEKSYSYNKLDILNTDKNKRFRVIISIVVLIILNVAGVCFFAW